jgi:hypothetical protein
MVDDELEKIGSCVSDIAWAKDRLYLSKTLCVSMYNWNLVVSEERGDDEWYNEERGELSYVIRLITFRVVSK